MQTIQVQFVLPISLHWWNRLSANGALQSKSHPALKTGTMEDMPTWGDHVCPSAEETRGPVRHAATASTARSCKDGNLDFLHADGTIKYCLLLIFRPLLIFIFGFHGVFPLVSPQGPDWKDSARLKIIAGSRAIA